VITFRHSKRRAASAEAIVSNSAVAVQTATPLTS
jgi:hypothetical protein